MKNPLKVVMIAGCPRDFKDIKGGVESASINLINGLINLPVDLKVISIREDLTKDEVVKIADNVTIYYYKFTVKGSKTFEYLTFGNKKVRNLCSTFHPDVIHLQSTGPIMLLLRGLSKYKIVITQHGILSEEFKYKIGIKSKLKFYIKTVFEKVFIVKYHNYISISDYNRKILCNTHHIKNLNTEIIYNPVNPIFFELEAPKEMNKIIFIGIVNKRKGLLSLINALSELKTEGYNYSVDVVGGTNEPEYLNEVKQSIEVNGMEKQVVLHSWLNQTEVLQLISENAILALPSQQESLPVCIAEAMSAGRVVIATDTGGISEMFTNEESGFLYSKNDGSKLKDILKKLYNNQEEIKRVGTNARARANEMYNPKSVASKTLYYFLNLK